VEATYADACTAKEEYANEVVRGLIVEKGPDGAPAIHVALFRAVDQHGAGELAFDMQALAKLKAGLSGNSSTSDYSLSMKDSLQTNAPKIPLAGVWKRVSTLDDTIAYGDLVAMTWGCTLGYGDDRAFVGQPGESFSSDCAHGTKHVHAELLAGPASPKPDGSGQSPSGEEQLKAFRAWADAENKGWKKCDPTGTASMALAWESSSHWKINVFSASTNPLYPPPDFYNRWSDAQGDVKTAFQIYWLITHQKAKSGAK
jgi:hypothetical protein